MVETTQMTGYIQPVSRKGQQTEPAGVGSAGTAPTVGGTVKRAVCAIPHACKDDLENLPGDSWLDVGGVPLVSEVCACTRDLKLHEYLKHAHTVALRGCPAKQLEEGVKLPEGTLWRKPATANLTSGRLFEVSTLFQCTDQRRGHESVTLCIPYRGCIR